jgi:hypothetical protein
MLAKRINQFICLWFGDFAPALLSPDRRPEFDLREGKDRESVLSRAGSKIN